MTAPEHRIGRREALPLHGLQSRPKGALAQVRRDQRAQIAVWHVDRDHLGGGAGHQCIPLTCALNSMRLRSSSVMTA